MQNLNKKIIIMSILAAILMTSIAFANRVSLYRVSAYTLHTSQTDSSPNVGACGLMKAGTIAVSRDLFYRGGKLQCGKSIILIDPNGRRYPKIIWDTMNSRYSRSADILFYSRLDAIKFGVRRNWQIVY